MTGLLRSVASLRFFGDDLKPDELDRLLGHAHDFGYTKGQIDVRCNRTKVYQYGSWQLRTEDREPADLDAQILEMLNKLTMKLPVWQDLTHRYSADIFCGLFMMETNEGISISPEILRKVGERGLLLDFDMFGPLIED